MSHFFAQNEECHMEILKFKWMWLIYEIHMPMKCACGFESLHVLCFGVGLSRSVCVCVCLCVCGCVSNGVSLRSYSMSSRRGAISSRRKSARVGACQQATLYATSTRGMVFYDHMAYLAHLSPGEFPATIPTPVIFWAPRWIFYEPRWIYNLTVVQSSRILVITESP